MVNDPIDISTETRAICQKLGLPPEDVASLAWTPFEITARVYLKNDQGHKYVIEGTHTPAIKNATFSITT